MFCMIQSPHHFIRTWHLSNLLTVPLGPEIVPIHLKRLSPSGNADTFLSVFIWKRKKEKKIYIYIYIYINAKLKGLLDVIYSQLGYNIVAKARITTYQ
jgi:hypothetical protein